MATIALIPAFDPDRKLIKLVQELKSRLFDIVIVDDGSDRACQSIFDECRAYASVIGYDQNVGKGNALKYGMRYIREHFPDSDYFLTADADGQHSVNDICRIRDELVSGADFVVSVRNLKGSSTPFFSRLGNGLSRFMFTIANARFLPDNQSGLRGFSTRHIDWMVRVGGEKYDYELNVILFAEKQGIKISRISIETIYFDNNAGTHFRPLHDTALIYLRYFQTNLFVLISAIIELVLVILATAFWGYRFMPLVVTANWGIHTIMCMIVERYTLFRWIGYTPGVRRLIISIFKYFVIVLMCLLGQLIGVPFALAYLIGCAVVTIGEYYMLKVTYDMP